MVRKRKGGKERYEERDRKPGREKKGWERERERQRGRER